MSTASTQLDWQTFLTWIHTSAGGVASLCQAPGEFEIPSAPPCKGSLSPQGHQYAARSHDRSAGSMASKVEQCGAKLIRKRRHNLLDAVGTGRAQTLDRIRWDIPSSPLPAMPRENGTPSVDFFGQLLINIQFHESQAQLCRESSTTLSLSPPLCPPLLPWYIPPLSLTHSFLFRHTGPE